MRLRLKLRIKRFSSWNKKVVTKILKIKKIEHIWTLSRPKKRVENESQAWGPTCLVEWRQNENYGKKKQTNRTTCLTVFYT